MDHQRTNAVVERRASTDRPDVRFFRLKEVLAICGKSRSSIYDAIKKGEFPQPVKLGGRTSAWLKSEVEQWAIQRSRARRSEAVTQLFRIRVRPFANNSSSGAPCSMRRHKSPPGPGVVLLSM